MGSDEMYKQAKEKELKTPPPTTTTQEQSSTTSTGTFNPDWLGYQAYSPIPPHGFSILCLPMVPVTPQTQGVS